MQGQQLSWIGNSKRSCCRRRLEKLSACSLLHIIYLNSSFSVPPHIEPLPRNIADIAIPIGSTLTIPCVASGFPLPEVEWTVRSKKVKFEVIDGEMNVVDFTQADVGDYTCVAENEAGRSRRHLQMNIDESGN